MVTGIIPNSSLKRRISLMIRESMPGPFFFIQYHRGMQKLGNSFEESQKLFQGLLDSSRDKRCLQIGVKEHHGAKFGPNWVSVDL